MRAAQTAPADANSRRRIMTVLFIGVFMAALDAAIIAPAVPALQAGFGLDNSQIGMVTIVFSLGSLSSTALMASLSDRYGRRPVYLICVAGFALGSLLIAIAPSFALILLGRAVQGLSAGGLTPTASAVVGDSFPPEERGRALGLIGATFGMAFLVGPLVASLILLAASWQWIFLLNLPFAAAILWMGSRTLPSSRAAGPQAPFDWQGVIVLAVTLCCLTLGINRVVDGLVGATVWPYLLGAAGLGLPLLAALERRAARPVLPPALFASRQLVLAYTLCLGAGFGMGSVIFITSLAVASFGTPPAQAGFLLIPLVLCSSAGSVVFGRLLNRLGARLVLLSGFAALGVGAALLGAVGPFWLFMAATMLVGLGVGVVVGGVLRALVLDEAPAEERGAAQGLVNIGIAVGNLLVVAVLGAVADSLGGGRAGLGAAYLVCAGVMAAALLLSLGLRPRQAPLPAPSPAG